MINEVISVLCVCVCVCVETKVLKQFYLLGINLIFDTLFIEQQNHHGDNVIMSVSVMHVRKEL